MDGDDHLGETWEHAGKKKKISARPKDDLQA